KTMVADAASGYSMTASTPGVFASAGGSSVSYQRAPARPGIYPMRQPAPVQQKKQTSHAWLAAILGVLVCRVIWTVFSSGPSYHPAPPSNDFPVQPRSFYIPGEGWEYIQLSYELCI